MAGEAFLERFWLGMAAHLWQSTAVLAVVFVLAHRLRGARASLRNAVWALALAKVLLPLPLLGPAAGALLPGIVPRLGARSGGEPGAATTAIVGAVLDPSSAQPATGAGAGDRVLAWMTVLWAAGATFLLLRWVRQATRAGRRHGRPAGEAAPGVTARLEAALAGTGVGADRVILCPDRRMPAVRGALRPRILLPRALAGALAPEELRAVLLHEAAHCRRRDPLVAHLQRLAQATFFFHPLLGPVLRRLGETAELACDERVLAAGVPPQVYRRALRRTVRLGLEPEAAPAALAIQRPSFLRYRLERLAAQGRCPVMTHHRILLFAAAALVALASFFPVVAPARATEPEAPPPESEPAEPAPETEPTPPAEPAPDAEAPEAQAAPAPDAEPAPEKAPAPEEDPPPEPPPAPEAEPPSEAEPAAEAASTPAAAPEATPLPESAKGAPAPPAPARPSAPARPPAAVRAPAAPRASSPPGTPPPASAPAPPSPRRSETPAAAPAPPEARITKSRPAEGEAPKAAPPAPPAPPGKEGPFLLGVDASEPVLISETRVAPVYPRDAREAGKTGKVILQAVIGEDGKIGEIKVLRGVPDEPAFAEAAVKAVERWRYEPATMDGRPVAVYFTIIVDFTLGDDETPPEEAPEVVGDPT